MAKHRAFRKTKVIATIGPACDSPETIKRMIEAGMNVARLNFSYGTHAEHRQRMQWIRQAAQELDANVATMMDTKGLEIRTGRIEGGHVELAAGDLFALFVEDKMGDRNGVSISHTNLPHEVRLGSPVLLDDGLRHNTNLRLSIDDFTRGSTPQIISCFGIASTPPPPSH